MQQSDVGKEEVEKFLGAEVGIDLFHEALEYAKRKQLYIYSQDRRAVVMEHWYLVALTVEYVRNLAFSKFTMDLCRILRDTEKEHLLNELGAPTDNCILSNPAS